MNEVLQRRFAEIGARLQVEGRPNGVPTVDVAGAIFAIRFPGTGDRVGLEVVDVDKADRHLLLLVRNGDLKNKFLCGYDERHWFVAAVPEGERGVTGVTTAKLALQPKAVRAELHRVRPKHRLRRRNAAFVRQGEWFFVPASTLDPPDAEVLRDEPLRRGRGEPHVLQQAYRRGGTLVWVTDKHQRKRWRMILNPELYATGAVRHPDHATVPLRGWHRVLMNTEQRAAAMRHVAFLD